MTGRSPVRMGVVYATIEPFDSHGVPVEEHFLPQTLKAAGYETAVTGKWHLGHTHRKFLPNARGFDHSYGCLNGRIDYFTKDREGGYDWHRDCKTLREEGYSTDLIAQRGRAADPRARPRPAAVPLRAVQRAARAAASAAAFHRELRGRHGRGAAAVLRHDGIHGRSPSAASSPRSTARA